MNDTSYKTLGQISAEMRIPIGTLKVKLHLANKLNIPLPPRRRIGKSFLYDASQFAQWLWQNADVLKRPFEMKGVTDDVESAQ